MKSARTHWLARRARGLALAALILAAVLIALVAPLVFSGCAGPGRPPQAIAQTKLAAQAAFLDGALLAKVTLEPVPGARGGSGPGGRPGGRHAGHRPPPGPGGGPGGMDEDSGPPFAVATAASVRLRVAVTNQGSDTLAFAITDVISELGNFAIRPGQLSLAPHQTAEIDPLGSAYPVAITELSVEIRVRHHGTTESHTLRLVPASGDL